MTVRHPIMGARIPPDLKREFAEIATQQNTTVSKLTRGLIQTFVEKNRRNNHATASN
ncbi:hypothetical protein RCF98_14270 [Thiothrix lacustris]|uniref:CopG-like ribbon-helix-helix domain-containing protein n=1 Tax=Thiothrix lacustris TaxID=525917 RepID=A0ABY9MNB9_9GAMM|nr:hypothetical protein [Thiothrix lacustris]WML90128.1 hypothetical protein RCF98_14270 [Thiothrix lacustris]